MQLNYPVNVEPNTLSLRMLVFHMLDHLVDVRSVKATDDAAVVEALSTSSLALNLTEVL